MDRGRQSWCPESRHEYKERKSAKNKAQLERIQQGLVVPPPGAGPNWLRNRESKLNKALKRDKRRHNRHEKRKIAGESYRPKDGPYESLGAGSEKDKSVENKNKFKAEVNRTEGVKVKQEKLQNSGTRV